MNTEVDSENNKSTTWSETKAKKRKQNMMDVDDEKDKRPHFPPVKKAFLVLFYINNLIFLSLCGLCMQN